MGNKNNLLKDYRDTKRSSVAVFIVLRILVTICLIIQLIRGESENAFMCLLTLALLVMPIWIQRKFKIDLPSLLEILLFFFIVSGTILGEIYNFYGSFPYWDKMLHTITGFVAAGFGFGLVDLLNEHNDRINLTPLFVSVVAFCFSMTIGVCWEFFEYGMDKYRLHNTQKDTMITTISSGNLKEFTPDNTSIIKNIDHLVIYDIEGKELATITGGYLDIGLNDTMEDLWVNLLGAVSFSSFGYFYVKNRNKYRFTNNFIPKRHKA